MRPTDPDIPNVSTPTPAPAQLSPAQKAVQTRKRRAVAEKAHATLKRKKIIGRVRAAEAASKAALRDYCETNGWKVAFFEGATGSPRTGIIDAIMFRLGTHDADVLDLRLVQLKDGKAGVSGGEIARLKRAAESATVGWLLAAFDGAALHVVPEDLKS